MCRICASSVGDCRIPFVTEIATPSQSSTFSSTSKASRWSTSTFIRRSAHAGILATALRQLAGGELGLPDLGPYSYDASTGAVGLWNGNQPIIHTTDGHTPLQPGWCIALWTDGTVTVGSPTTRSARSSTPQHMRRHFSRRSV